MLTRGRAVSALALLALTTPSSPAASKPKFVAGEPHTLSDLEAQVKLLTAPGKTEAPDRFEAFAKWAGVAIACPDDACKTIASAKLIAGNLDPDGDDEKILAITTRGAGTCATASLEVIVFDSTPKGWVASGHARLAIAQAAAPVAEALAAPVHSAKVKDLLLRVDGQCPGTPRQHKVSVHSFETGKLVELASSEDTVGTVLASHALVGTPPVTIELTDDKKGVTKLNFVEAAFGYDALPSYEEASKKTLSNSEDLTLSTTECAAPLGGGLALECNLQGTAKVQVLVQKGKALGLTVSSEPAKPSFVRCMRKAVAAASWKSVAGASGCTRTYKVQ